MLQHGERSSPLYQARLNKYCLLLLAHFHTWYYLNDQATPVGGERTNSPWNRTSRKHIKACYRYNCVQSRRQYSIAAPCTMFGNTNAENHFLRRQRPIASRAQFSLVDDNLSWFLSRSDANLKTVEHSPAGDNHNLACGLFPSPVVYKSILCRGHDGLCLLSCSFVLQR